MPPARTTVTGLAPGHDVARTGSARVSNQETRPSGPHKRVHFSPAAEGRSRILLPAHLVDDEGRDQADHGDGAEQHQQRRLLQPGDAGDGEREHDPQQRDVPPTRCGCRR